MTIHRQGNGTTAQGGTCIQKCDLSSGPDSRVAGWTFAVRPTLLPTAMTAGLAVTLVVAAICTGATQENAIGECAAGIERDAHETGDCIAS